MKIWNKTGSDLYVTTEVGQFMFGGVAMGRQIHKVRSTKVRETTYLDD